MAETSQGLRFSRNNRYYRQVTFEFNLPAGWACPGARDCLTKVDKETGKRVQAGPEFLCYAASAERYPGVRDQRWHNFTIVKKLCKDEHAVIELPKTRHMSVSTAPATSSIRSTSACGFVPPRLTPKSNSGRSPSPPTTSSISLGTTTCRRTSRFRCHGVQNTTTC